MTKIVEKYFEENDFLERYDTVRDEVVKTTGFIIEKELFRGMIYDSDKLGSVIYKGLFENKPAVLKIQGLKPETDEIDIVVKFNEQNMSKKVRLPEIYDSKQWDEETRYGYQITEYISAPHIFEMPFATDQQMRLFCEFYEEYRENCLNRAFVPRSEDENRAGKFVLKRIDMWKRIARAKQNLEKRLLQQKIDDLTQRFEQIITAELANTNMVFCHGHLTAKDIHYEKETGQFILLSNLYWSYRPEFYDLVFGLHWDLESISDSNFSYQKYVEYVKKWLHYFHEIPVVRKDSDAKRKIHLMMLERTMGGILLDTGSRPFEDKNAEHLLSLQLRFFEELVKRITAKEYF